MPYSTPQQVPYSSSAPSNSSPNYSIGIPLSQYTELITRAVAAAPSLNSVWVCAELSDVRSNGGHCYLELIEKNAAGQTIAKLRANIWRNNYIHLRQKFFNATQRDITTGIKALVRGTATHHNIYGLSFNITDIDPSYTLGDMERIRREIILRLQKEGVANINKSLTMPLAPQKIAVISAEGAAGYGDFMNHLKDNSEGFVFYPCLFPSMMQGDRVSESIRNALQIIESSAHIWDCVVIVRGGGATTDLNGFDDYDLARAVATCGLPVIVGIGHERDRNVLDEIANVSLKTPTAVANFFIDRLRNAYDKVLALTDRLRSYSNDMMRGEERRLSTIQSVIPQLALRRLQECEAKINMLSSKLPLLTQGRVANQSMKLKSITDILSNLSSSRIGKETLKIDSLINLLKTAEASQVNQASQKISNLQALVNVLDPRNTLARGYSITRVNGKAVKSVKDIPSSEIIHTTLYDGEFKSSILP